MHPEYVKLMAPMAGCRSCGLTQQGYYCTAGNQCQKVAMNIQPALPTAEDVQAHYAYHNAMEKD